MSDSRVTDTSVVNAHSFAPEVSVVMPFYQAQATLERAISSVTSQSFVDWELVLVDDGSTDGGSAIADGWARRDARVRVVRQTNSGRSAARNQGLDEARGRWVTFVDADDRLPGDALSTLTARSEGIDLVWGGFRGESGVVRVISGESVAMDAQTLASLVVGKPVSCPSACFLEGDDTVWRTVWGKLYRMDVLKRWGLRFAEGLRFGEDALFNLAYLQQTGGGVVVGRVVYLYDDVASGTCTTCTQHDGDQLLVFARTAHEETRDLVERGVLTAEDVDRFVGAEAAMTLRRAGGYAPDLSQAARWLAPAFKDEDILRALDAFVPPQSGKARALHRVRRASVRRGLLGAALLLERLAFRSKAPHYRSNEGQGERP